MGARSRRGEGGGAANERHGRRVSRATSKGLRAQQGGDVATATANERRGRRVTPVTETEGLRAQQGAAVATATANGRRHRRVTRRHERAAEADGGGYKRRWALKRCLKLLLYEQECFQEELRRAQRKLLRVSRDKSFLLDRLLQYRERRGRVLNSEATASSDNSDGEGPKGAEPPPPAKRRRSPPPSSPPPPGLAPPPGGAGEPPPYLSAVSPPPYSPFPTEYLAPEGAAPPRAERPRPPPARRPKGSRRLQPPAPPQLPLAPPLSSGVPRRMLSDGGDDDDALDGDDELVIDIPE
ncbi:LOW QUALITY PROTEIN: INO80 complex subunit E [Eudromia elegans]